MLLKANAKGDRKERGDRGGGKGKKSKVVKGSIKIPPITTLILKEHD